VLCYTFYICSGTTLPFTFNLQAVFVDLGWPIEPAPLACYAEQLGIPFTIEKTLIARIGF